ncbi:MAG: DNA gyrase subunit B [Parcubacteria group bacterium Gr01-1014_48]|nr:MAG: DNA gyrase subunit B [Parcubacteria group bacterium Greene0416_14]TSC73252.1 MAG: DNA gyrase subunit B [Parcubacteria group bacterium Gr01-1014_48]TSD01129.1 MAG: DNA gyrase subunit B [Parcubacteria group bacterium Greene1014_15]TSD08205.1 MAG: DNA gyrase subunit B [Parcubacteria group bacterium Greene0714_4]
MAAKKSVKKGSYSAQDITVLEGLEPVRKRPGMYIGTTGPEGLHHLIWEAFDNARDEAMAGHADDIEVVLLPNNLIRVADNGRGIPVDMHPQTKVSALETIMTTLHAGGKFGGEGYTVSGGLHGVGISVANALSNYACAVVYRDGGQFIQEYKRGKPQAKVKRIGPSKLRGTVVMFTPDDSIFEEVVFDFEKIVSRLRQQAYLVRGMRVTIIDARNYSDKIDPSASLYIKDLKLDIPSMTFYFEGGLISLVKFLNQTEKPVHKNVFYVEKPAVEMGVESIEVALQYIDDISSRILAFANNTFNPGGGTHLTGFKTALTRTLNTYARKANILKEKEENFTGDDVLEGITAVISVKLREVQFEGQTKDKLGSVEARGAVENVFGESLAAFLEENPEDARMMVNKTVLALKARKAAKAAKDSVLRKGALEGMTLPGKLADCQSDDVEETELYIVEGDSAGGSAKMARDRRTQAILPLFGKVLNVERARLDKVLSSDKFRALVIAIGAGIGDEFNMAKLRYGKLVIMADADVDGSHIKTLYLTFFYRYFKQLIEDGHIYIAVSPLYKVKKGKEVVYLYSDEEKIQYLGKDAALAEEVESAEEEAPVEEEEAETESKEKKQKISVQRYKGLGEMSAEELWETTMDPARRIIKKVTVEDAQEADKVFDILMGTDVVARKSFIQSNAKAANVDI